jgi:mevalonate kinase
MIWRGTGFGKLILFGEHAVVYGHKAIAASLPMSTSVTIRTIEGPTTTTAAHVDVRLMQLLTLALPQTGLQVEIEGNLPLGRGLGSSAALSVALLRAKSEMNNSPLSNSQLQSDALDLERIFHGNPSGIDNAVAAERGVFLYTKAGGSSRIEFPDTPIVILDSMEQGNTKSMVEGVAANIAVNRPHLAKLGEITESALGYIDNASVLGELMNKAHAHLKEIGVSNAKLDELVDFSIANGAVGAKLSGAGGGGVVVALTPCGGERLIAEASSRGIKHYTCTLSSRI